jgi:hypothetical protein
MPTYIAKTPIKQMPDIDTKVVEIVPIGGAIVLPEAEADELLNVGAIEGPVDTPKKK